MRYSGPESLSLRDQTKFDVLIQIDVLSGCEHSCTGCFVNKHSPADVEGPLLREAKRLADGVKRAGLNLREFVVGPTDFFSASNTESVLNNKITQEILREHVNARIATPAKFDLVNMKKFYDIFKILDNPEKYRDDMIIEFVMPVENPDTMLNNTEYFEAVMRRVDFFKNETPKKIDWSWTLQSSSILSRTVSKEEYNKMLDKSLNEYGTILEMNPAFSRAPRHKQKENLKSWNNYLSSVVDSDNYDKVTMSMANLNCNSMNFVGLTVIMGKDGPETHLNVMLHEQAFFLTNPGTNVTGLSFEEILERRNELILDGIKNLSIHPLYKDSPYLISMANRLLWEAIKAMDLSLDEEILPMDVLSLYNPTEEGAHLWNKDALKRVTYQSGAA
jgi:hypothetical protein